MQQSTAPSLHEPRLLRTLGGLTGRGGRRKRSGFSLVEILVAMTILVILAAVVVPRFSSARRTEALLGGDQIEDLMRMWAFRSSVGTQQVGIWRNPESGLISIMVRDYAPGADPAAGDVPEWIPDFLSNPVRLPETVEIVEVQINYEIAEPTDFFVQTNPDRTRPQFLIRLRDSSDGETLVSIEPYSNAPIRVNAGGTPGVRVPVDLDAEGEENSPW
jgi:prepilin-type N-terminal cleavage/methylation domain-containing protein